MAAGNSRRFLLGNKLLYEYKGKPLFLHGLEAAYAATEGDTSWELVVVSQYEEILSAIKQLGLRGVYSPNSVKGASYTIKAGLAACSDVDEDDYIIFMVADQPEIYPATIKKLMQKANEMPETACICYNDRRGNPVMFRGAFIPELMALTKDQGGRKVMKNHSCVFVEAEDEKELFDLDTIEDFAE